MINPAFIIILLIAIICVWFLAANLYKPLGKFINKMFKRSVDSMNEREKSE